MTLDNFLPHVLVELPGCSDPLVKQTLLSCAIEFCQMSLCWDEVQDPVALVDNTRDYDLEAPSGAVPYLVKSVWVGARQLTPVTLRNLQSVLPGWRDATGSEPMYYNAAIDRSQLSVYPLPLNTNGATLVVRVALAPRRNASVLPDFLGDQYLDAIAAGVKSRLMAMPGQAWSNLPLVPFYRQTFLDGIFTAKAEMLHERVVGTVTVAPRAFGF